MQKAVSSTLKVKFLKTIDINITTCVKNENLLMTWKKKTGMKSIL